MATAYLPLIHHNGSMASSPQAWSGTPTNQMRRLPGNVGYTSELGHFEAPASANNSDQGLMLEATPSKFVSMTTLVLNVTSRTRNAVDDTVGLHARVMSGSTVLAAATSGGGFQQIRQSAGGWADTDFAFHLNDRITFSYVNATATKTEWDAAQIEFRQTYASSMSSDGAFVSIASFSLHGTYEADTIASGEVYLLGEYLPVVTSTTVKTATVLKAAAVGNYMIARVACDNSGTSGAARGLVVSDTRSNTWTVLGPVLQDPGAANEGVALYIAYAKITTQIQVNDTVTLTFDGASGQYAAAVGEWTGIDPTTPLVGSLVSATGGTGGTTSLTVSPGKAGDMVYGVLAVERQPEAYVPGDTDTTNGVWVPLDQWTNDWRTTGFGISSAGAASDLVSIRGAYKVVTGTGDQTWNETTPSGDWAAGAIVFNSVAGSETTAEVAWIEFEIPAAGATDHTKTINDPIDVTDSLSTGSNFTATINDNLGLTDSLPDVYSDNWGGAVTQGDNLGLADTLTVSLTSLRSQSDSLGLADSRSLVTTAVRSQTDALGLTDGQTVDGGQSFTRTITIIEAGSLVTT